MTNELLLHTHQLGVADLDAEIATGHHDGIGAEDDVFHRLVAGDGFGALDLGHYLGVGAGFAGQFAGVAQIIAAAGEGDGQVVHVHAGGGLDVFLVLLGQGRRGETTALLVDPLVVGERPGHGDRGVDAGAFNLLDFQLHTAVVQQQDVAGHHVVWQTLVVDADLLLAAFTLAEGGIEHEFVTDGEVDLAILEGGNADLGALQVPHDGHMTAQLGGDFTHLVGAQDMIFRSAVREVHPHHVGTGADDPLEDAVAIGRRTECGYNLCTSWHERLQCEVDMT
ncbi:hypothetical protein D3C86_718380 [compost metagenome]